MPRLAPIVRVLFGDRPSVLGVFFAPTLLAVAMDLVLRPRALAMFPPIDWANYFGSAMAAVGFWAGPLWLASRLFLVSGRAARAGLAAFAALFVFPLSFFCYGGQALYFNVFHAYMARDTVRLGIALRGTLGAWLASWGASVALMAALGLAVTALLLALARRAAAPLRAARPILPVVAFAVSLGIFWVDRVESRSLQAAPPDTCFIHGVVHAARDGLTGKGWARQGMVGREPAPLPRLPVPAHRPSVLLVVTESVRADALCSSPSLGCRARFLDEVAPERLSLGRLTTQSSGTFTACAMLWTGLPPTADLKTMHRAPVVWEVARALGYRTAYIGAQNLRYDNFGAYLTDAGIDLVLGASDLGEAADAHVGAPDENATERLLRYVREVPPGAPYFAVLHLSNTHWPYRVDPALQPFTPHDEDPLGDAAALHNHYKNSVLLQERTVAALLRALRALPGWDDTVVVFVSDHGEEFREHGMLYHLSSLFDEQVRVPGFLIAGPRALSAGQRAALATWERRRTYSDDVHATLLDVLGVDGARLPYADEVAGRSLLRPATADEPMVPLSTSSGVWEPDVPVDGMMRGELLAVRRRGEPWACFDAVTEPVQRSRVEGPLCDALTAAAVRHFDARR